jgi:hypothetical protein
MKRMEFTNPDSKRLCEGMAEKRRDAQKLLCFCVFLRFLAAKCSLKC